MATIWEILYQSKKEFSNRQISKSYMICRKTVGKYVALTKEKGLNNNIDDLFSIYRRLKTRMIRTIFNII